MDFLKKMYIYCTEEKILVIHRSWCLFKCNIQRQYAFVINQSDDLAFRFSSVFRVNRTLKNREDDTSCD